MPGPGSSSVLTNIAVRRRQLKAGRQMLGFERGGSVGQARPQSQVRPNAPPQAPSPQPATPPSAQPTGAPAGEKQRRPLVKVKADDGQNVDVELPEEMRQQMLQRIQQFLVGLQTERPQPVMGRARRFVGGGI